MSGVEGGLGLGLGGRGGGREGTKRVGSHDPGWEEGGVIYQCSSHICER